MRRKGISKGIILTIYCVCMFFASLILLGALMNRGNTDMTAEMSPAGFPLVSFVCEGMQFNTLHGYANQMEIPYLRDTITPLMEGRNLSLRIDTYGTGIEKIAYEVRTMDASRLIEDTQIYNYVTNENIITADITLKDLLEEDQEYSFCILLQTVKGDEIRYYTRIIEADDYQVPEKLEYVYFFNDATFDKYTASNELPTYLESNAEGNNTTFHKVNIHSSLNQVTWGNLPVERVTEPVAMIRDIESDIANIEVQYFAVITENEKDIFYAIEEYYRIRQGEERFYLLDYERTMEQIFDLKTATMANNKIMLGIMGEDVQMAESSDGSRLAFVNAGGLYSYNITDNKMSKVFGFLDDDITDLREVYQEHDIKIFHVDETGNVTFMVYGYMNRGIHEGEMGAAVYYYDSVLNTVEEEAFIPYTKSYEMLEQDILKLSYVNSANDYFIYLDHAVYQIGLSDHTCQQLVTGLPQGAFTASGQQQIVAWASGADLNNATQIIICDLTTGKVSNIEAEEDTRIRPIGFFGEDFVYGVARKEDILRDATGKMLYPMYQVLIRDVRGNILKQYEEAGIYVVDTLVSDEMITMVRMKRDESNRGWSYTTDDQILYNDTSSGGKNTIEVVTTENYEKIIQIVLRKEIDTETMQVLEPKQVLFEENRNIELGKEPYTGSEYYLYVKGDLTASYAELPEAIDEAYRLNGVVVDDQGTYLYRKTGRVARNQIMAINPVKAETEGEELAVCLDVMLALEGYTVDTAPLLRQGREPEEILEEKGQGMTVLDLNGCKLDIILYYVAQDIPVLARMVDGSAVLVIGYNEYQIVVMNPQTGTNYKISMNEASRWFEENGNWFLAYLVE
ncbi:MAG: hypothetical protein K2K20_05285 [Lachnospiraceae bacterium]|nr:hypothetical protein [Lachnospiraceae bacterium]